MSKWLWVMAGLSLLGLVCTVYIASDPLIFFREKCERACLPYQVKSCHTWGSSALCYTDKPGVFVEKAK
jgi:hypothetical protein